MSIAETRAALAARFQEAVNQAEREGKGPISVLTEMLDNQNISESTRTKIRATLEKHGIKG
ncbi:hypothetical protein G6K72_000826 [Salmonella enterica subsp. enterica serovar Rubislaw]|nr:hypothetical protein [Salmonella enterica subsp. enterica serovar Rubislaw]